MLPKLFVFIGVFCCGFVSCKKEAPTSEPYARALKLYSELIGERDDDAYLDPRMREVEGLLNQVQREQREFSSAQGLLVKIQEGSARANAEQSKRQAMMEAVLKEPPFQHSTRTSGPTERPSAPPSKVASPPQAVPASNQPESGMASSEFLSRFGACFARWQSIEVRGQGPMDAYELKDIANCRERHGPFVNRLALLGRDSVYSFIDKSAVRTELRLPDGGSAPDGGLRETRK